VKPLAVLLAVSIFLTIGHIEHESIQASLEYEGSEAWNQSYRLSPPRPEDCDREGKQFTAWRDAKEPFWKYTCISFHKEKL